MTLVLRGLRHLYFKRKVPKLQKRKIGTFNYIGRKEDDSNLSNSYTLRKLQMAYLEVKLRRYEEIHPKDKCTYCWNPIRSCEDACKTTKNTY